VPSIAIAQPDEIVVYFFTMQQRWVAGDPPERSLPGSIRPSQFDMRHELLDAALLQQLAEMPPFRLR